MSGSKTPVKYTGEFKKVLEKYVVDNGRNITLAFVDASSRICTTCEVKYSVGFGLSILDCSTGEYFSCFSALRFTYANDGATWHRFMLTDDVGGLTSQSIAATLGVDPRSVSN